MEQILANYAKEGVFLALFLYMLLIAIPNTRKEAKQDLKDMEERHNEQLKKLESRYTEEIKKVEEKGERRESDLMRLLSLFSDKYEIIAVKVDEVIKILGKKN